MICFYLLHSKEEEAREFGQLPISPKHFAWKKISSIHVFKTNELCYVSLPEIKVLQIFLCVWKQWKNLQWQRLNCPNYVHFIQLDIRFLFPTSEDMIQAKMWLFLKALTSFITVDGLTAVILPSFFWDHVKRGMPYIIL